MRKIVLTLTFLLLSSMGYTQVSYTMNFADGNVSNINVLTGSNFKVFLNLTSISGSYDLSIDIGTLNLISVATALPYAVGSESQVINGNNRIVTIPINGNQGNASFIIELTLKVPFNICNDQLISISSSIMNLNPSQTIYSPNNLSIIAIKSNNLNAQVNLLTPNANYGNTVIYNLISSINLQSGGYNLSNVLHEFYLPDCANIIGVYKDIQNYAPISETISIDVGTPNTKIIKWERDIVSNEPNLYIIVSYPCDISITCNSPFSIKAKLSGSADSCYSNVPNFTRESNVLQTSFSSTGNDCIVMPLMNIDSKEAPCPTCNSDFSTYISLGISNANNISSLVFTVAIDPNIDLLSETGISTTDLPGFSETISYSLDGINYSTNFSTEATSIRFSYSLVESNNLNSMTNFRFTIPSNYVTSISQPFPTQLNYITSLSTNGTVVFSNRTLVKIVSDCDIKYQIKREVSKINGNAFSNNIIGTQGDEFTFKYTFFNYNTSQNTIRIENLINAGLIYKGGFKCIIKVNETFQELSPQSINPLVYEYNGQSFTITIPQNDNNTLVINNLSFPAGSYCVANSDPFLIFEFNVKVGLDIIVNEYTSLVNNIKVFNLVNNNFIEVQPEMPPNYTLLPIININPLEAYDIEMYVKCPTQSTWIKGTSLPQSISGIDAKQGEQVFYKLKCENRGTVPIKLQKIINTRPFDGDTRQSTYDIFYNCFSPIVKKNIIINSDSMDTIVISPTVTYNNEAISYPAQNNTQLVGIDACDPLTNKMMFFDFNNNPENVLKPKESIDIYYKSDISSDYPIGIAKNSAIAYALKLNNDNLNATISENANVTIVTQNGCTPEPCIYCASFDLKNEEKYLISGWVKEVSPTTSGYSSIDITFLDTNDNTIAIDQNLSFYPSGKVIDGWQRIMGEFVVPQGNLENQITLDALRIDLNNSSQDENDKSYFDDIRIIPSKANMKSFVYDQKTQRLMAELDENNYATFYEYDLEGGLVRIKKETEKGVFTIQETRSNSPKKAN